MRNKAIKYISLVLLGASLTACERVIDLNLPDGSGLPYVDAWITDQPGVQTIKFLKATEYQSQTDAEAIGDAQITVTDVTAGKSYPFTYANGAYNYDAGTDHIGVVGHNYKLSINWKGEQFEATDTLKRSSIIDSLTSEYKEVDGGDKAGYYVKLYAHDPVGAVDFTWIRTYRNGQLNYYVGEMLSADGTFGEGTDNISDGFTFIPPFRDGVTSGDKPYDKGDVVKVLFRSLSKPSYQFMEQVQTQLTNDGLFGKVLTNVPANVFNLQSTSKTKIYGWFGTVAEISATKKVE
ncbi:hypothetical protein A4D02_32200 [Niastella koreensis]|uniref:DUF4249 domain-containing protein n=2 Tax=Niastella koreensis TaxID=354356 RepID=G8TBX1_NIAKG|nr:DUF4249 family protein [Niastella koreensis]AEV99264.1 hypothetical protein Niako_2933 [Niastella koreensis GR20-10]OQP46054.1 hypothetical protein A4D02_32200 [Niastella koreensis]